MSSSFDGLSPREKALLTLALTGQSVIDWGRAFFSSSEEITRFLKTNELDLAKPGDVRRLEAIHRQAVDYLTRELDLTLAPDLRRPKDWAELFLTASDESHPKIQRQACSLLKVMNIITHLDGRELLYHCPISLRDLFGLVQDKVERVLSTPEMKKRGLVRYQGGRKLKGSLVTKLLSKRETIAAQIYDRVRFRLVARKREDLLQIMLRLFETVLPFNYVIPEVSINQLVPVTTKEKWAAISSSLKRLSPYPRPHQDYSGRGYKICKFVVDIPVRMDRFLKASSAPVPKENLGSIAYVLVEFQAVDEKTDRDNNSGDCSHDRYKARQKYGVIRRLLRR